MFHFKFYAIIFLRLNHNKIDKKEHLNIDMTFDPKLCCCQKAMTMK